MHPASNNSDAIALSLPKEPFRPPEPDFVYLQLPTLIPLPWTLNLQSQTEVHRHCDEARVRKMHALTPLARKWVSQTSSLSSWTVCPFDFPLLGVIRLIPVGLLCSPSLDCMPSPKAPSLQNLIFRFFRLWPAQENPEKRFQSTQDLLLLLVMLTSR